MQQTASAPAAVQEATTTELTLRGVVIGALITLLFTAANVYLGLKVGLTFATSIPAAVISMAVLRMMHKGTIQENNIVQTVASAAGTISSVIFVLPGLMMIGWWSDFPYWQTLGICVAGGLLGVTFTIPLRRALVSNSDLPYPEGVAAAEVLRVGTGSREGVEESRQGLIAVVWGSIVSAVFALLVAMQAFAGEIKGYIRIGAAATGFSFGPSLALLGVGHLIGLAVGIAIAVGFVISWGIAVPILTALHPAAGTAEAFANSVWRHQVRFLGAGTIGIAAIWTLLRLLVPVWQGIVASIESSRVRSSGGGESLARTEHDLPFKYVIGISAACVIPMAILSAVFLSGTPIATHLAVLAAMAVIYVFVVGFIIASVAGYMAGLIGSSNSPISGLGILSVVGISLLVLVFANGADPATKKALVAFALFVTSLVLSSATIANDNLQDLKTGQLVDATPWKQQVALMIGVIFGSAVIAPVLSVLAKTLGFVGMPHVDPSKALGAPQATLISQLAQGIIEKNVDWTMIGIGALVGLLVIAIDEYLRGTSGGRRKMPPLAVGLGIYLPMSATLAAVFGAIIGHFYNKFVERRRQGEALKRLGVLMATGLIVGESLFGVLHAGIIYLAQQVFHEGADPLALIIGPFNSPSWLPYSEAAAVVAFAAVTWYMYRWVSRLDTKLE